MPTPRLHPFFRLLIAVFGTIVVTVVVVGVIGAIMAFAAMLGGQNAIQEITRFFTDNALLSNALVYPPILLWLWFCRRYFDRRAFVSLGLRAKGFLGQFAGGILCGFLTCAFTFGVLWLSGNVRVEGWSPALQSGGWSNAVNAMLGWALMMLCVGFMEEILFRGYALHNLHVWLGARAAIGIQAAIFALIHLGNLAQMDRSTPGAVLATWLAMPNIFLIGIFFALCYLKTGSLWFPIAFHAAWNFFLGCVFSLPVSGLPIFKLLEVKVLGGIPLSGGAFGPEASLLLTPILLALIFAASRVENHRQAEYDLETLRASTTAMEKEEIMDDSPIDLDDDRENRFRTRMGKRQKELDDETRQTLRLLNDAKKESAPFATPSTLAPLPIEISAPETIAPVAIISQTPKTEAAPEETEAAHEETELPPVATRPSTPPTDKPEPPAPRW